MRKKEKIKKVLAFFFEIGYYKRVLRKWLVGQGVKTSPSHGENRGSIPLVAAMFFRKVYPSGFFVSGISRAKTHEVFCGFYQRKIWSIFWFDVKMCDINKNTMWFCDVFFQEFIAIISHLMYNKS